MESPGPSDVETGIEWNRMRPERQRHCLERWELNGYFSLCLSLTLPGVSVGLEEISVSVGCEIRKLGKGGRKYASLFDSSTPICGNPMATSRLRCGTIMVARIRRKFCQYRM